MHPPLPTSPGDVSRRLAQVLAAIALSPQASIATPAPADADTAIRPDSDCPGLSVGRDDPGGVDAPDDGPPDVPAAEGSGR